MDEKVREKLFLSLNIFLQFLGHSTYGVFVPIFILKAGFSLEELFLYGLSDGLGTIAAGFLGPRLIRRFGIKSPLLFRAVFQPIWLISLVNHTRLPLPMPIYGFVFGAFTGVYWLAVNAYTISATDEKERGTFSGIIASMVWVASIVAPLLGAFVIGAFGYSWLFASAIFIIALAIIPASLLPEICYTCKGKRKPLKNEISPAKRGRFLGAFLLMYSILGAGGLALYYAWPLYTYFIFSGETGVALIASLGSFFGLFGSLFGGWIADKMSKTRIIAASGAGLAFAWMLSGILFGKISLAIVISGRRFLDEVTGNAFFAKFANMFSGEDDIMKRLGQRQLAIGFGLAVGGVAAQFLSLENLFVLVGALFLVYSAAISNTKFETGRKLTLPKGAIIFLEKIYQN